MKTTNPFPGMNPYLEAHWPDVHTRLIAYIGDAINEALPGDLNVRVEEQIVIDDFPQTREYRADVAVIEAPIGTFPQVAPLSESNVSIAEPEIIQGEEVYRWLEIRDRHGRLITVIEVLSLSNKRGPSWLKYLQKQHDYLASGANLVEIDLLRNGERALSSEFLFQLRESHKQYYLIVAARALRPSFKEIYYCPLMQRLPAIRVPLRPTDLDIPLDLQPLIDRCYETGRYWQDSFGPLLSPPLTEAQQAWVVERLAAAGLQA